VYRCRVGRPPKTKSELIVALASIRTRASDLNVQQDILETFIDRGLRRLAEPTITPAGKRIPGLRLDHPRQLALMHALVRFAHIAAGNTPPKSIPTSPSHSNALSIAISLARSATISPNSAPGARHQASKLSPLSTPPARIFNLSGLPEALRAHLYAACRRPSQPHQRRRSNPRAKPISPRPPLSACRR